MKVQMNLLAHLPSFYQCRNIHRVSRLFPSVQSFQKVDHPENVSVVQNLIFETGVATRLGGGTYTMLPVGMRALNKLMDFLHQEMEKAGAAQVSFPSLQAESLFKKSRRLESFGEEIFKLHNKNTSSILAPTHEEIAALCVGNFIISKTDLPIRLYQISQKFRNELNVKYGFTRTREFLMKDLYAFDESEEKTEDTYELMTESYLKIFKALGLPIHRVEVNPGIMGGSCSHEYHLITDIGEDKFYRDINSGNIFSHSEETSSSTEIVSGLELGHTFKLGTKYSSVFKAQCTETNSKPELLHMSCYGIGVSRLFMAILEYFSSRHALRWPSIISPYQVAIIPPKRGSKEAASTSGNVDEVLSELAAVPEFQSEILIDDRNKLTVGKRMQYINKLGIPHIIVIGKKILDPIPLYEIIDNVNKKTTYLEKHNLSKYFLSLNLK